MNHLFAPPLALAVLFSIGGTLHAQSPAPNTQGEKIVTDAAFFPKQTVRIVQETIELQMEDATIQVDESQRPKVADIQRKYGKPDRIVDEVLEVMNGMPPTSVRVGVNVHYYGRFGLCVPKNQTEGRVVWIRIPPSQPGRKK